MHACTCKLTDPDDNVNPDLCCECSVGDEYAAVSVSKYSERYKC